MSITPKTHGLLFMPPMIRAFLRSVNPKVQTRRIPTAANSLVDGIGISAKREVELADAVIRIFDLAGAYNMDLAGAIAEKLAYNQQRADHKPENRAKAGGKAY
jgi:hypothetical protein